MSGIIATMLKKSYPVLSVSVAPTSLFGSEAYPVVTTTSVATATPSGGVAPYTYSWTAVSSTTGTAYPLNPTNASTYFRDSLPYSPFECDAVFKCTVTDAVGQTAISSDVNATFIYYVP